MGNTQRDIAEIAVQQAKDEAYAIGYLKGVGAAIKTLDDPKVAIIILKNDALAQLVKQKEVASAIELTTSGKGDAQTREILDSVKIQVGYNCTLE